VTIDSSQYQLSQRYLQQLLGWKITGADFPAKFHSRPIGSMLLQAPVALYSKELSPNLQGPSETQFIGTRLWLVHKPQTFDMASVRQCNGKEGNIPQMFASVRTILWVVIRVDGL
jgi:hypothetical protein